MCERDRRPNFKRNPDVDAIEQMVNSGRSIHDVSRTQRVERAVYEMHSGMHVAPEAEPGDNQSSRDIRMQDPRPWVSFGASQHERTADGTVVEPTAFRRLTSIVPGETQPTFGPGLGANESAVD